MSKVKIQGHASGSGTLTLGAPNTDSDRTITLPDTTGTLLDENSSVPAANLTGTVADARISALTASKLTGALPAISGASLTSLPAQKVNPNLIINGAMQVAQRSTSTVAQANDSNEGFATLDRWSVEFGNSAGGTITTSQDTESPAGFGYSTKLDVTTAATASGNELIFIRQTLEAQDMRTSGWEYTSASSDITLSFWVRNSKTGIYCIALNASDASRMYTAEYTVSSANTWEKKTITIPGEANLVFNNDTNSGLFVAFMLDNASGRYGTAGSWATGNHYGTSNQVNFLDSTSNVMYLTGVKLEIGDTATDYVHRSYAEELALCQRYYQKTSNGTWAGFFSGSANLYFSVNLTCPLRASPTVGFTTVSGGANFTAVQHDNTDSSSSTPTVNANLSDSTNLQLVCGGFDDGSDMRMAQMYTGNNYLTFSAEI